MDRHRAVRHSDPALHPGIPFQYDRRYGQRPAPHVDLTALWDRDRAHQPFPPIYHNFLVFFYLQYLYLRRQKEYIWGGIVKYEEKEE